MKPTPLLLGISLVLGTFSFITFLAASLCGIYYLMNDNRFCPSGHAIDSLWLSCISILFASSLAVLIITSKRRYYGYTVL